MNDISKLNCVARSLFGFNLRVWKKMIMMFGGDSINFLMRESCRRLENHDFSISYRVKPKQHEKQISYRQNTSYKTLAIVLQGPIRYEEHYTVETVYFYRTLYPDAIIIVSTWDDEDQQEMERIREASAIVISSQKPSTPGILNINYQIASSKVGIEKAIELGAKYVCKSRTDQRIYKPYIYDFLINLVDSFPPSNEKIQDKRLVTLSTNYGNMFYPYFVSDFFYFGTSQEMIRLFNIGTDDRSPYKMPPHSTRRDYAKAEYAPEVYLLKKYLKNLGFECKNSVEAYWEAIQKYLICVDIKLIDLDWPKYEYHFSENVMTGSYFEDDNELMLKTANVDFVNWLNLYNGTLKYVPEYEKYADVSLG